MLKNNPLFCFAIFLYFATISRNNVVRKNLDFTCIWGKHNKYREPWRQDRGEADPQIALLGDRPHVIDEWLDVPAVWDEVRAAVDQNGGAPGQFILNGSTQPHKDKVHHSGGGRAAVRRAF